MTDTQILIQQAREIYHDLLHEQQEAHRGERYHVENFIQYRIGREALNDCIIYIMPMLFDQVSTSRYYDTNATFQYHTNLSLISKLFDTALDMQVNLDFINAVSNQRQTPFVMELARFVKMRNLPPYSHPYDTDTERLYKQWTRVRDPGQPRYTRNPDYVVNMDTSDPANNNITQYNQKNRKRT